MADYDCDYCFAYDEGCPYVGWSCDCYVEKIKEARGIVDCKFLEFLGNLELKNNTLTNDTLDTLIGTMRNIVNTAWEDLPEWAEEELKNESLESD